MPVAYYMGWYTPEFAELNPDVTFVFGDNTLRVGKGGQAVIRDCPNAHGIATKRAPDMTRPSFFTDDSEEDRATVESDLAGLRKLLEEGRNVIIPMSRQTETISLGLERAQLPSRAPGLYKLICDKVAEYQAEFGSWAFGKSG